MGEKLEAERAYRLAYAPLRSAQHALDIIARNTTGSAETRTLAREESKRIEQAIDALTATPDRSDYALAEERARAAADAEIAKYTGTRRQDSELRHAMNGVKYAMLAALKGHGL